MGQSRLTDAPHRPRFSSEDITRMVCILMRKFGAQAPSVAQLMAAEHKAAGDLARARAWRIVAERAGLLSRQASADRRVH